MTESSALPAGRRLQVLRVLRDQSAPMSINEVAAAVAIHPNTVRFHLETLVAHGQVERVEPEQRSTGRPPQLFKPAPGMDPTGPRGYRLLAQLLVQSFAQAPDQRARAIKAGEAWGAGQAAAMAATVNTQWDDSAQVDGTVHKLVQLLAEVGFAPELSSDSKAPQIGLHHCPFLELAVDQPQIVCAVHLGIMQGALAQWDAPAKVDRLDPFVTPNLCMTKLLTAGVS
ncbi:MAG: helix-turn-helix domain-containing protein [Antricoccus sp.]